MAVRLGQQTGDAVWALVKVMPIRANRSRFGVWTFPEYPPSVLVQSFMSSTAMKRTPGCDAG